MDTDLSSSSRSPAQLEEPHLQPAVLKDTIACQLVKKTHNATKGPCWAPLTQIYFTPLGEVAKLICEHPDWIFSVRTAKTTTFTES